MKSKSGKMVLLIISFALFLSIISLLFALKIYLDKNKKEIIKEKKEPVIVDKKIDENQEFKDILDIINLINTSYNKNITDIYDKEINITDINNTNKIYSIIYKLLLDKNYDKITIDEYNQIYLPIYGEYLEDRNKDFAVITKNKIEELYKKIYTDNINYDIEPVINNCPSITYENDRFYINMNCTDKKEGKLYYYIYKKVTGTNSMDIYLSLAVSEKKDKKYYIYSYNNYPYEEYQKVDSELFFNLDKKNYNTFSKYLVHFKKIDNKYYFDSVRKI